MSPFPPFFSFFFFLYLFHILLHHSLFHFNLFTSFHLILRNLLQLIGWFNAGSDQKVEAPDLFGCVQLPLPAACFGTSETPYGAKQRAALMSHLREEKAQSMPWLVVRQTIDN